MSPPGRRSTPSEGWGQRRTRVPRLAPWPLTFSTERRSDPQPGGPDTYAGVMVGCPAGPMMRASVPRSFPVASQTVPASAMWKSCPIQTWTDLETQGGSRPAWGAETDLRTAPRPLTAVAAPGRLRPTPDPVLGPLAASERVAKPPHIFGASHCRTMIWDALYGPVQEAGWLCGSRRSCWRAGPNGGGRHRGRGVHQRMAC